MAFERECCVGGGEEEGWRGGRDLKLAGGHSTDKPAVRSSQQSGSLASWLRHLRVWGGTRSGSGKGLASKVHSSQPDPDKSRCIEANNLKPNLRATVAIESRGQDQALPRDTSLPQ